MQRGKFRAEQQNPKAGHFVCAFVSHGPLLSFCHQSTDGTLLPYTVAGVAENAPQNGTSVHVTHVNFLVK